MWLSQIEREEQDFAKHIIEPTQAGVRLNTIGAPQMFGKQKKAVNDHAGLCHVFWQLCELCACGSWMLYGTHLSSLSSSIF